VAWKPLGWQCVGVAEIEPFPCAVLARHYPDVPNLGDVSKITTEQIAGLGHVDLIIGGFPCQDVSVAGKRRGLEHHGERTRSGLFFDAMRLVRDAREHCGLRWLLVENVPGLYSNQRGRDFARVVGDMVGAEFDAPRGGWPNTGAAVGPKGLVEWRSLDAQYFGLAQRRKRLFALADFGDWRGRPPVLLEPEGLQGNPSPRHKAGKDVAPTISSRPSGSGGLGTDVDLGGGLIACDVAESLTVGANQTKGLVGDVVGTLGNGGKAAASATLQGARQGLLLAFGGNNTAGPIEVATALSAHSGPHGRQNFASETFVTHPRLATGFDASEDGTGRGIPIVPVHAFDARQRDVIQYGDMAGPLDTDGASQAICFTAKDHGADAGEIAPTLRSGGFDKSHANGGVGSAIAFALRGREGGAQAEAHDAVSALRSASGGATRDFVAFDTTQITSPNNRSNPQVGDPCHPLAASAHPSSIAGWAVRRLTPTECERLQGFPDGWTRLRMRHYQRPRVTKGRPADRWERADDGGWWLMAADGPRYAALGNSMAVPLIRWIGERISAVCGS